MKEEYSRTLTEKFYIFDERKENLGNYPTMRKREAVIIYEDNKFKKCEFNGVQSTYNLNDWEFLNLVSVKIMEIEKKKMQEIGIPDLRYKAQIEGNKQGEWVKGILTVLYVNVGHVKAGCYISNKAHMPYAYKVIPETLTKI